MKRLFATVSWRSLLISTLLIIALSSLYFIIKGPEESSQNAAQDTNSLTTGIREGYQYETVEGSPDSSHKILLIQIKGLILTERLGEMGFFEVLNQQGFVFGYDIRDTLFRAAENPDIQAVFIEINSPGGTIGGSKAIGEGIEYYKEMTSNPVYAHIVDQGTSGGYWAAAATDDITAEVGSIVGSIGVIMGPFRTYNTVLSEGGFAGSVQTQDGIDYQFFTGGEYKDTGSPYREMTEEEQQHWQESLDNEYDIFASYVSTARDIPLDLVRNEIRALPYGNTKAQRLGLIDRVGGNHTALALLRDAAGIPEDNYELITEQQEFGFFDSLFQVIGQIEKPQTSDVCQFCNRPLYLYDQGFTILHDIK